MRSEDATYPGVALVLKFYFFKVQDIKTWKLSLGWDWRLDMFLWVCGFIGIIVIRPFFLTTQHYKPNHDLFGLGQPFINILLQIQLIYSRYSWYTPDTADILQIQLKYSRCSWYTPDLDDLDSRYCWYTPDIADILQIQLICSRYSWYTPDKANILQIQLIYSR